MVVLDVHRAGAPLITFKNCTSDAHCICAVGGSSSYSGVGSGGDYLVASQSKKPVLNVYQWGKPQPHQQCHIQEITTALACEQTGTYLLGGTKKGWIYCWEVGTGALLTSWQAHFKAVTKILFTTCGQFAVSCSEDGMVRAWDFAAVLSAQDGGGGGGADKKKQATSTTPYRSWSPHTLTVKDMTLLGGISSVRVVTVSLDRTAVLFDLHANKQCFRAALPQPLESACANRTGDVLFLGSSSGSIFLLDLSIAALGLSAAHALVVGSSSLSLSSSSSSSSSSAAAAGSRALAGPQTSLDAAAASAAQGSAASAHAASSSASVASSSGGGGGGTSSAYASLEGHTRAVTSIVCSIDNCTIVSGGEDGSVRVWDYWTRQCLRELKPLHKAAVTSLLLLPKPEIIGSAVHKPSLVPFEHLKKYSDASTSQAGSAGAGGLVLPPRVFGSFSGGAPSLAGAKRPWASEDLASIDYSQVQDLGQESSENSVFS
jgi:pre-rRNA-processing protein IPI3